MNRALCCSLVGVIMACHAPPPPAPIAAITALESRLAGCYVAQFGAWTEFPEGVTASPRRLTQLWVVLDTASRPFPSPIFRGGVTPRAARVAADPSDVFATADGQWAVTSDSLLLAFWVSRDGPRILLNMGLDYRGSAWQPPGNYVLDGKKHGSGAPVMLESRRCGPRDRAV
jgi:hypothetical protein